MTLSIFSFQRAFAAMQKMALAAGNCTTSLAAIESKDIRDCLHLGLGYALNDSNESNNCTPIVGEFIANCEFILKALSDNSTHNALTISLSNNNCITLKEKNGDVAMKMNGERATIPNLTLQNIYENLINDIQNNPDLYGNCLVNYANNLAQNDPPLSNTNQSSVSETFDELMSHLMTNHQSKVEITDKAPDKNGYTIANNALGNHFITWFKDMLHKGETVRALNLKLTQQTMTINMHIKGTESHPIYAISFCEPNETKAIACCEVNKLSILENHTLEQYIT